jgi:hypothetical protein
MTLNSILIYNESKELLFSNPTAQCQLESAGKP